MHFSEYGGIIWRRQLRLEKYKLNFEFPFSKLKYCCWYKETAEAEKFSLLSYRSHYFVSVCGTTYRDLTNSNEKSLLGNKLPFRLPETYPHLWNLMAYLRCPQEHTT
jgi:hypothetical protein